MTGQISAFERYLLGLSREAATEHVLQCLVYGEPDSEAWILMEEFNGKKWKCPADEIRTLIGESLDGLEEKYMKLKGKGII